MLKMISLKERARIVFSNDDAVKVPKKKDSEDVSVFHLSEVEIRNGKKPFVFTVRLLNARERMQTAESGTLSQTQALFSAAERCICKIEGPGIKADTHEEVSEALLAFNPEVVFTIAGWIVEKTSLKPDPLGGQK